MGFRRILDVSTDEPTQQESQVTLNRLRSLFVKQDGTINALAVGMSDTGKEDLQVNLCTPHGRCFEAKTWSDYASVIRQKIASEIA